MDDLEKMVWAAAFAAEFASERAFLQNHSSKEIDSISGYSCAEVADVCLEKYREAIASDDCGYLYPVKESKG
jgi:hypothetical protein